MHLLAAQRGAIADEGEAIDLAQLPGDICVLSAADTELASLAAAQDARAADGPSLRLVNLMRLAHPMSVDAWIEATGRHAKLIVVRALGGRGYSTHLLDALRTAATRHGFALAALPGDGKPDPELADYTTIDPHGAGVLWRCLTAGGADNCGRFLEACADIIAGRQPSAEPRELPSAGVWLDGRSVSAEEAQRQFVSDRPTVAITFYRALVLGGQTQPIDALVEASRAEGLNVIPIYAASLKDAETADTVRTILRATSPRVVLNATGFAISKPGTEHGGTVLDEDSAVVLQVVLSGSQRDAWVESDRGLGPRDLAMNVALPEVDGRVLSRAISFKRAAMWHERTQCDLVTHEPEPDRIRFVAELARRWATIPTRAGDRRIAIVLANYPTKDGRIGNGVGLDTPAGTVELLRAMQSEGYQIDELPSDGNALIERLLEGRTNGSVGEVRETLALPDYEAFFDRLPTAVREAVLERWGAPERDKFFDPFGIPDSVEGAFALPILRLGKVVIGIQPARGYDVDPKETYHSPDLVPPHGYLAFYAWLRANADAIVHMGKHGNMEWLPGKALALSETCFPEAVFGPMPHVYPFIVNDPGEGSQAKRRAQAVIVDHLTPPLTRAEAHGPMAQLEGMVDEYFEASATDARRTKLLATEIMQLALDSGVAADVGITDADPTDDALAKLDGWLCELKEHQIRDGLHVFGRSPEGRLRTDLLCALARVPSAGEGRPLGLTRALADDLALEFDPLDCQLGAKWDGPRPDALHPVSEERWRTVGDTVERLELFASKVIETGERMSSAGSAETRHRESEAATRPDDEGPTETLPMQLYPRTTEVLATVRDHLAPALDRSGAAETRGVLRALEGRFVPPGPSGAPTRGRPDVLPTGRNFYSVDTRAVPTPAAWELGRKSAELVIVRHLQDHGDWPRSVGLTCWGTSCMRTGGDDLAQALALVGARPVWEPSSRRVTGFEVVTLAELGRPRVDVTLRISGFFRDAFPDQIALFDRAVRAIGALNEPADDNPIAGRMRAERATMLADGLSEADAVRRAGYRVFGSKPGAYGAGLQALIDEGGWGDRDDLAEAYTVWGSYAYGAREDGRADREVFERRFASVEAVLHNQDNREHDLLDSDDYYQFEGGMSAAIERLRGEAPAVYHNDHSRPERPVVRSLEEEVARVVRARVTNPKWISGVMRHGYKGAFEIAATVDYLFAFAATTNAVKQHHFDAVHAAFIEDDSVRDWMGENNPNALREMRARFAEAIDRGLWRPRSNSARMELMEEIA